MPNIILNILYIIIDVLAFAFLARPDFSVSLIEGFCFVAGKVHSISSIMPSRITESAKVHKAVNEIDKFR